MSYRTVSIGLQPEAALRCLRIAPECQSRRELVERLAATLRQPGAASRRAVANKLVQRYASDEERRLVVTPLAELVCSIHDRASQLQLLYYRLTQVDDLVGAMAREIVYPYFIAQAVPQGFARNEFLSLNGQRLIDDDPWLVSSFCREYAQRRWGFSCMHSLATAQRILAQSGRVRRRRLKSVFRHPYALFPGNAELTTTTFVYALYDEFASRQSTLSEDDILGASFCRTLLIDPAAVLDKVRRARHYGFLRRKTKTGELRLTYGSLSAAVEDLSETAA